ncbi:MAG: CatA-like O-acetyltransferase [Bacilli bacterium]|jgi:chloramphenicol O-acetyltransferase type A
MKKSGSEKRISDFFASLEEPRFTVVSPLDVTKIYKYCEINGISFYYSLCYLAVKALNSIEEFHYKIQTNGVFTVDELVPSFTDLRKGTTDFYICILPIKKNETMLQYAKRAKDYSQSSTEFMNNAENSLIQEMVYISCLPWIDFSSVVEAKKTDRNDSIVHLTWGKYVEENGKLILHCEIQVNHRLVDGLHVGLFFNRF